MVGVYMRQSLWVHDDEPLIQSEQSRFYLLSEYSERYMDWVEDMYWMRNVQGI
jgi:hypothetical protein